MLVGNTRLLYLYSRLKPDNVFLGNSTYTYLSNSNGYIEAVQQTSLLLTVSIFSNKGTSI